MKSSYSYTLIISIITVLTLFIYSCTRNANDVINPQEKLDAALSANSVAASLAVTSFVGQNVTIKGSNNLFVSGENGTTAMNCNRSSAQAWEQFILEDAGGGKVALRSMGKYLSSENGQSVIKCNRTTIQDWEKFTMVQNSNGTVSFKGNNGKYVSSENGQSGMTCNRTSAGGWEQFTLAIVGSTPPVTGTWRKANLTYFTSYPDPNSEECIKYNGCKWAGQFKYISGQMPESWVRDNNIIAVHENDGETYKLKTFELRQGNRTIQAKVYDVCSDQDCNDCCTQNANQNGLNFLIDIESYTMARFGSGDGIVEWRCLDCN